MKLIFVISAVLMLCVQALALPEKDYDLDWQNTITPFIQFNAEPGDFYSSEGLVIRYVMYKNPDAKNTIVISPGRAEYYMGYAEIAYDLYQKGFSVFIIDHRGQGFSDRMLADGELSYVGSYQDYVSDFEKFIDVAVKPDQAGKLFLLAHGTGTLIGSLYMNAHPEVFQAAAFTSPLLSFNTSEHTEKLEMRALRVMTFLGRGKKYGPHQEHFQESHLFEKNEFTHSKARFDMNEKLIKTYPAVAMGGASTKWMKETLATAIKVRALAPKLTTPILLLQAGGDLPSRNLTQNTFCSSMPACKMSKLENSRSGILMEEDTIRSSALNQIAEFFDGP